MLVVVDSIMVALDCLVPNLNMSSPSLTVTFNGLSASSPGSNKPQSTPMNAVFCNGSQQPWSTSFGHPFA